MSPDEECIGSTGPESEAPCLRLSARQRNCILDSVREAAGDTARVMVFGSRSHWEKSGGDLDLFIESSPPLDPIGKARLIARLEDSLALPVDIVATGPDRRNRPIHEIARRTGVPLQ